MANFFDQFDSGSASVADGTNGRARPGSNFFDQFDAPESPGILRSGLRGVASGLGRPGDLRETVLNAPNAAASALGLEMPDSVKTGMRALGMLGMGITNPSMLTVPTSQQTVPAAESVVGKLPEPQTTGEKLTEGVTSALADPLSYAGGGGLGLKLGGAALSGAGSELGREVAGTPGAIAGGMLGGAAAGRAFEPKLKALTPSPEQVVEAGAQGYKSPAIAGVVLSGKGVSNLADDIVSDLGKRNARLAPQTHAIVDELRTPVNGQYHTIEDLETSRKLLGQVAGKFSDPVEQGAASTAIKTIDRYLGNVPAGDVLVGNAKAANEALTTARQNYALGKSAGRVQEKMTNAELQAASSNSGANVGNKTRQQLRPLLTSAKQGRGLSDEDLAQIENTVTGSGTGNALRVAGNLLGGGGGLGGAASAYIGHALIPGLGIATPAVGYGIKKAGDYITKKNANAVVSGILSRSPEAKAWAALNRPQPSNRNDALARALLNAIGTR